MRRHHESFDPNEAADLLSSTTGLAVGITSMVAALKGSTDKLEILIKSTHTLQHDLCRSLEAVGEAVTNMARASESLAAGVNHNTRRVGAIVGEFTKLKKHVEWSLDVSMKDVLKDNKKGRMERDQSLQDIMTQLQESMGKLQENLKLVAERIERGTPPAEVPPAAHGSSGDVTEQSTIGTYDASWTWPKCPTAASGAAKTCNPSTTDVADGAIRRV